MSASAVALNEDRALPFLGMAWSRSEAPQFFNRHVLPALCPGREVKAVAIEDMTYFPGRKCEILYSLQLDDTSARHSPWAVATFTKDDRAQKIYARHYGEGVPTSGARGLCPAVCLPEYGCVVELFPWDWRLPSLRGAMNAAAIRSLLPAGDGAARSGGYPQIQVLRYRPHLHCVMRYALESAEGPDHTSAKRLGRDMMLVGKVYSPGPHAAQAWRALHTLHSQAIPGVTIPGPFLLEPEWNLVLMECAPGTSMKQVLAQATSRRHAEAVVRLAVRTLVWLHNLRLQTQTVWTLADELGHIHRLNTRVRLVAPQLADQVNSLLDRLATLAPESRVDACIHGDCKPSQFLVDDDRVALVDFDRGCLGDVAVDIGNFTAALHKEAVRGCEHSRELASFFLAEYERCSGKTGLGDRARVFRAAALVRMAVSAKRPSRIMAISSMFSQPVTGLTEDSGLPNLPYALDGRRMLGLFDQAACLRLEHVLGLSCTAEVLSHKLGQRCTIRYTLTRPGEGRPIHVATIIAKLYGKPELAKRLYGRTQDRCEMPVRHAEAQFLL